MVYNQIIKIDGVDVTSYRIEADVNAVKNPESSYCSLVLSQEVTNDVSISNGSIISITEGPETNEEYNVYYGYVLRVYQRGSDLEVVCRDPLWYAKRRYINRVYDINIDPEAGKISAIAEDLLDAIDLPSTVVDSGTDVVVERFIVTGFDIANRLDNLALYLNWQVYFSQQDRTVHFEPKTQTSYGITLSVGGNVLNQPIWALDIEQTANVVTVNGATREQGGIEETFSGTGSKILFILENIPNIVEIYIGSISEANRQTEGVPGVTENFDYSVNRELKIITFETAPPVGTDNVIVVYSAKLPVPVKVKNYDLIQELANSDYPNGLELEQQFSFDDIKTVDDAKERAITIRDELGVQGLSTDLEFDGFDLHPGMFVTVNDTWNNRVENVVVTKVRYDFTNGLKIVEVGDREFDLTDTIQSILFRIRQQELKGVDNNEIFLTIFDPLLETDVWVVDRLNKTTIGGDFLYWDHPTQGEWDNFDWGPDTDAVTTTQKIVHPLGTYYEDLRDDDFVDSGSTTATVSTSAHSISFTTGQVFVSEGVYRDVQLSTVKWSFPSGSITGQANLTFEVQVDGSTWEEVNINESHTIVNTGTEAMKLRITASDAASILLDDSLGRSNPWRVIFNG